MNSSRPARRNPHDHVSTGDRLVSAVFGAVVGALTGAVIAFLLDGGSSWLRASDFEPSYRAWALGGGLLFGVFGLALGSRAATVLGSLISAVWHVEAYAYWWYWPWRVLVLGLLASLAISVLRGWLH